MAGFSSGQEVPLHRGLHQLGPPPTPINVFAAYRLITIPLLSKSQHSQSA